jgi:pimeloyl-ACP methyl ester carboxylesterase
VQIIAGDHDPGVLPVNGDYLHERLPHSKSDKVDAGHFAWADAAEQYAALIIEWWNGEELGSDLHFSHSKARSAG